MIGHRSRERWFTLCEFVGPLARRAVHIAQPDGSNACGISEMARMAALAGSSMSGIAETTMLFDCASGETIFADSAGAFDPYASR